MRRDGPLSKTLETLQGLDGAVIPPASAEAYALVDELLAARSESNSFADSTALICGLLGPETPYLVQLYCQREQEQHNAKALNDDATLVNAVSTPQFWPLFFLYSTASGRHILERVLEAVLSLSQQGAFDSVEKLLLPECLAPLRPFALLLAWKYVRFDPDHAAKLLKALNISAHKADERCQQARVNNICERLAYNIRVVEWCKSLETVGGDGPEPESLKELFRALNDDTISMDQPATLRIVKDHVNLYRINDSALVELLAQRPGSVDKADLYNRRDAEVLKSLAALKSTLNAIIMSSSSADKVEAVIATALEDIRRQLQSLSIVSYRLETLENIFSMLFLTEKDIEPLQEVQGSQDQPHFLATDEVCQTVHLQISLILSADYL